MRYLLNFLLLLFLAKPLLASSYVQQNTFSLPVSSIVGMDRDALGNLYVLGLSSDAVTYQVSSYATPGISPLFSFNIGLSKPAGFAVEESGIVDVLDTANGFTLKRFENTGTVLSQVPYSLDGITPNLFSIAIDKLNDLTYIAYQYTYTPLHPECAGCRLPSPITKAMINQYDFQGNLLRSFPMSQTTSCDTPNKIAVDPQGNLYVADEICSQILKLSAVGLPISSTTVSWSYLFYPKGMWTDTSSNLYISEYVCNPNGCLMGIVKLGSDVSFKTSLLTTSDVGCAWDQRILYTSPLGSSSIERLVTNTTPTVPIESGPIGMIVQHSPAATLSWQASSNSDGDSILYTVYLGTNPSQLSSIGSTNQTGITTQSLASGGTYYWQVVAQDYYLGIPIQQVLTPVVAFNLNLINNPPGYFSVLTGTGTFETRNSSQTLSWTQAVDPDSDEVYYELSVSTIPEIFSAAQISTATYYNLNFDYGTTYYWLVSAYDGLGGSSTITGSTQTFLPLFIDQPPQMPTLISPFTKSPVVMTMANQVNVSWQKVSDPQNDPITYTLYVGESAADMPALAVINQTPQNQSTPLDLRPLRAAPNVQISVVSQDTSSISVNLTELGYYQNYYMQVAASNLYGATAMTQIQTFSLASSGGFPKAYNYPNPFSPNRGGTHIVFNAPSSGYSQATVEIYSEWQALLFKHDYFNIPPGISQVTFDGHDRYGHSLFNGSYICRVRFSGPRDGATFYMLVVK